MGYLSKTLVFIIITVISFSFDVCAVLLIVRIISAAAEFKLSAKYLRRIVGGVDDATTIWEFIHTVRVNRMFDVLDCLVSFLYCLSDSGYMK